MRRFFPDLPGQAGLCTREQLKSAGWTKAAIAHLTATVGRELYRDVFVSHRGPLDAWTNLVGAQLWAGPHAWLTADAALAARRIVDLGRVSTIRFLVPSPHWCAVSGNAMLVRTRRAFPAPERRGVLSLVPLPRALLDASRYETFSRSEIRALTIKVLQRGLTTPGALTDELKGGRRNWTKAVRQGLDDFQTGAWSLPEVWLGRICRQAGLPPLLQNVELRTLSGELIGVPDGYFADQGVAVQVHSRQYHDGEDDLGADLWERTVEHDSDFAAHGITVVGVAPTTLRDAPSRFLVRVTGALSAQQGRPRPQVVIGRRAA